MNDTLGDKLGRQGTVLGTQAFLGSREALEVLGGLGYDFVFVCAEHPAYGIERVYDCVKACQSAGTPALVRLPAYDPTFTKKVLDMGVDAVLFPMIRSAAEADRAMRLCLYPPLGERGFGPMSAVRWGIDSEKGFVSHSRKRTVRMIQLEHIDAVDDLETIVEDPRIDAYIFGPNDLAASMGHILDTGCPEVKSAIERAASVLRQNKKAFGVSLGAFDIQAVAYWRSLGARIFSLGADFAFLRDGAADALRSLKEAL